MDDGLEGSSLPSDPGKPMSVMMIYFATKSWPLDRIAFVCKSSEEEVERILREKDIIV